MKKRLRLKHDKSINSWHSNNWTQKSGIKYKDPQYPAFQIICANSTNVDISLDFIKGVGAIFWADKCDGKLVAQFISRLVNKYYSKDIPITVEIRDRIVVEVKKYIQKTRDMVEKF